MTDPERRRVIDREPYSYATVPFVHARPHQPAPPALTAAFMKRLADATREISAAAIYGVAPKQDAAEDAPGLTFGHWRAIRAALLSEPALIAVWFVDSIDLYHRAARSWPKLSGPGMWYPSLVVFDTHTATASAWLLAPWFASFPGVWAEMSDGQHVLFVPKKSRDESNQDADA